MSEQSSLASNEEAVLSGAAFLMEIHYY